jgi:hypothetical protein
MQGSVTCIYLELANCFIFVSRYYLIYFFIKLFFRPFSFYRGSFYHNILDNQKSTVSPSLKES